MSQEKSVSHDTILEMLAIALIEIRATENLALARSLADVFHNSPVRIARAVDPVEILDDIRVRAARCGQSDYVEQLLRHVLQR